MNSVNLDDYNIHVIASVLKQWLRDLPSPLMTFELYEEFLRAMGEFRTRPLSGCCFIASVQRLLQLRGGLHELCVGGFYQHYFIFNFFSPLLFSGQPDKREVIRGVYSVIDQLSRTHLSTLERLIFHLVR